MTAAPVAVIHTDGGKRGKGSRGPAACSYVIDSPTFGRTAQVSHMPDATVNEAEYTGLINALRCAQRMGEKRVSCLLDSKLVVEQALGNWAIKEPRLQILSGELAGLAQQFDFIEIAHVPRALNKDADELCTKMLDLITGKARTPTKERQ